MSSENYRKVTSNERDVITQTERNKEGKKKGKKKEKKRRKERKGKVENRHRVTDVSNSCMSLINTCVVKP